MTTSLTVKQNIKKQGRKKSWLAKELGVSRPTLDNKIRDNYWSVSELVILKRLGLV